MRPIIDAHLDLAWNALQWNRDLTSSLEALRLAELGVTDHVSRGHATVSLPELHKAGVRVCLATVLARAKASQGRTSGFDRREIDYPNQAHAYAAAQGQLAYYRVLEARGYLRMIRTREALQAHWAANEERDLPVGVILAMEGADPIVEPSQFREWWDQGLRCVGLAHYGQHPYATGTGGNGPLAPRGRELLAAMDRAGAMLDLTHCAEPGFQESLDLYAGPVLASHCMCRAIAPGDRQLSDEQIRLLVRRRGLIGMACDNWMIAASWLEHRDRGRVPLSAIIDHVDHVCQLAGSADHVCIGSDLDGGYGNEQCPHGLDSVSDLQALSPILSSRGYSPADIDKIMFGNLLEFLLKSLPSSEDKK